MSVGRLREWRRCGRTLRSRLVRPADYGLAVRMALWCAAFFVLKSILPLPALVRLAWSGPCGGGRDRAELVNWLAGQLARLGRRTGRGRCLEVSLAQFRYLSTCRADTHLVLGVCRLGPGTRGHAWVVSGGRPAEETDLGAFTPFVVFGPGGRRTDGPLRTPHDAARP